MEYENKELERIVEIAKEHGYKVYAFQPNKPISQVFITNGVDIGTVSASYGGVSYSTVHKPNINTGTGFGMSGSHPECDYASIDKIKSCVHSVRPYWATGDRYIDVKKWESWDKFQQKEKILKYFEV